MNTRFSPEELLRNSFVLGRATRDVKFQADSTYVISIDLPDNPYEETLTFVVNAFLTLYYEYNIMVYEISIRETPGMVITLCFWNYHYSHIQLFEWLHVNHGCNLFQGLPHHFAFVKALWKLFFGDIPYSVQPQSFSQAYRNCIMVDEPAINVMARVVFTSHYGIVVDKLQRRFRRDIEVGR